MRHDTVQTLKRPILLDLSSAASLSRMSSALNFSLTISLSLGTKSERRFHLGLFAFFHSVRLKVITKIQKASKPFQSRVIWRMNTAILRFNLELSQQYPRSPPPFPHLEMYGIWLSGESELVGVSSGGANSLIANGVRGPSSVKSTSHAEPSTSFRSGRRFPSEENSSPPKDARDDGSTIKSLGDEVDVRGGVG